MVNPFKPTFGRTPPLLVGRDDVIVEFATAIEAASGSALATLLVGARGSGKTVLLNALEDAARSQGWIVFSETATPGLVDRLVHDRLGPLADDLAG
ncbi:MAG TPA: ATP-binding protein, partial [Acidimicrobiaceae bacterium]|nr:ATP-binding protein [Acidimicrobiaceae bacterium]